jgi:glycine cleavage system transcriptional repressor
MLTLVGRDRPGIVADVTNSLFEDGCQLGEASMIRLGGNFTVMLMVQSDQDKTGLENLLSEKLSALDLRIHVDPIEGHLHEHIIPDVCVSVYGADRPGIVAEVTHVLKHHDFHILDLESDVAGTEDKPIYIMHIDGKSQTDIQTLEEEMDKLREDGIDVKVAPIEVVVG